MGDLDGAIRARLDEYEQGDSLECHDDAIRAVLDLARDSGDVDSSTGGLGLVCDWEIREAIAGALGVGEETAGES